MHATAERGGYDHNRPARRLISIRPAHRGGGVGVPARAFLLHRHACAATPWLLPSWPEGVAERSIMDKPRNPQVRALADAMRTTLNDAFAKQGFASTELVTRWAEIVGADIAAHSEPEKIQW